jgi:signal transduction histidine kinase
VRLDASAAEGMLVFAVSDTGAGIASEHLPRLFQEFSQIDNSSTRKHGGTGLGLAISRRMARLLGGDIAVHSTPEKGSTFTVSLPLAAPHSALGESRPPLDEAPGAPRDALARAQSAVAH